MHLSEGEIREFQERILGWYAVHQRDLPWRKTRDPYRILVSEVMLQQTQVNRVIPKYMEWLRLFPTVKELAAASVADVLRAWSGLGYNRRALFLKRLAEVLVRDYDGKFPEDEKLLLQLPGIGMYTARAILCFAFDKQVAVVDTNVKKVHLTQLDKEILNDKEVWALAEQLVPEGRAYDWNQALMDYASMMLKQEKIAIPKQSKFAGSRRYYRGKLLKTLVRDHSVAISAVPQILGRDGENQWGNELVEDLEREGFVKVREGNVELA
jgi:A/G-specific adenine glycosylase